MKILPEVKNNMRWGFVSGRISVLEGKLLPKEFFLNLIAQEHIDDLLQHLQETLLRDYLSPGMVWGDFTGICDRCFHETALSIKEDSPSSLPADFFLLQGDYLNLKSALKGSSDFQFPFGLLPQEKLVEISQSDRADLPHSLQRSDVRAPGEPDEVNTEVLDIFLDGAYLRNLLSIAQQLKSELVSAYIRDRVLSYVVTVLWRALRQQQPLRHYEQYVLPLGDLTPVVNELSGIPNVESWPPILEGTIGETLSESLELPQEDQISGFELRISNHLTRISGQAKLQTAGPERVFSFLAGFQVEIQNLKLVVNGRLNRIDRNLLRQRLRETYV